MIESDQHRSHPVVTTRLKKALGHLQSTITMIGDQRSCIDIAQQLHAVERAIDEARELLVTDHIDSCIDTALASMSDDTQATLEDLREIARYL